MRQAERVRSLEDLDPDACYRAVRSKDARFDGVFFSGVTSTGIYCRPSCPAVTPKKSNLTYHRTAAAAQEAGFRACKRCRPDASPGSPEWNIRHDMVGRAMRLIADGTLDRESVKQLAAHVGYSERQLNRQLVAEVGAGPLALARAQRARTARTLLESSSMSISDVAFAAGFASIRQFNDTIQDVFAATPTQLRAGGDGNVRRNDDAHTISVRLPHRQALNAQAAIDFLGQRAVVGIESYDDGAFVRSMRLPLGDGVVRLAVAPRGARSDTAPWVNCDLWLDDLRDLTAAVQRCRRMLDLDADPGVIDDYLAQDDLLKPLVAARPGMPLPGSTDPHEVAFRVVVGQQVSTTGARTVAARLVQACGRQLRTPVGSVTHVFPDAATLADVDPGHLSMPSSRKRAITTLARALAEGSVTLDAGSDWDETEAELLTLHGIGPWTVAAVRMRALGDPDVFLATDLGIRKAMAQLGASTVPGEVDQMSMRWRPWRSYVTQHLWASLEKSEVAVNVGSTND